MGSNPAEKNPSIRTPARRLRVFVSADSKELASERAAVNQAITRLRLTPVMFTSRARPHPPRDLYQAYLAESDIYIGIYCESYGWTAPGDTVSALEDEYNLSGPLPHLIYVKSPAPKREPGLRELLARIKAEGGSYRHFSTAGELAGLVENDLAVLSPRLPQPLMEAQPGDSPTSLPAEINRFVGREIQVEAIRRLLLQEENRLVSLTGPGGIGKTRLALKAAAVAHSQFPDGVFYIDLSSVGGPALLLPAIALAIGDPEAAGQQLAVKLKAFFKSRRALLVLDNLDRQPESVPLVVDLLSSSPRLKLLVTSRAALRLNGELEFPVSPLSLPGLSHRALEAIAESEAVQLFASRAGSSLALTPDTAPLVADICRRLDGLPLAIELAAGWVHRISPPDLLACLDERLNLNSAALQNLPLRQRTLRAAIEWSYNLLEVEQKTVLTRLAVFHGGCTLEAAEAICNPDGKIDLLDCSGSLVGKGLLRRSLDLEGHLRFELLETLREFALERLDEGGEISILQERHARFYRSLAREITRRGPVTAQTAQQLEFEIENLRAALEWSLSAPGALELGLGLANDLFWFWSLRGHLTEAKIWFERLLDADMVKSSAEYAAALSGAGIAAGWLGDRSNALGLLTESIPLLRGSGDRPRLAQALLNRGILALEEGRVEDARSDLEEALNLFRAQNDRFYSALCLMRLGETALAENHPEDARRLLAETTSVARSIADPWLLPAAINNQGEVARYLDEASRAGGFYDESGALFHETGASSDLARVIHNQAYIALRLGDTRLSASLFRQSLDIYQDLGIRRGTIECLAGLACVDAAQGRLMPAARLLGFAQAQMEQLGLAWRPADRREIERAQAALKNTLGEDLFGLEESAGRKQKLEHVLAVFGI